ncbi:hypothetical protein F4680DRAFT_466170 [Xylaria scruposa]|nr:hypothetical protein F4680DRAFT_466170 [Xylaria scruposa]
MDVAQPVLSAVADLNNDSNAATSSRKLNIYVDEASRSDRASTPGTKEKPFQTLFAAYIAFPPESNVPSPSYFTRVPKLDDQVDTVEWREPAKSAMKEVASRYAEHLKRTAKQNEEEAKHQASLVEARNVIIQEDPSLPEAVRLRISAKTPQGVILGSKLVAGTRVKLLCLFEGKVNVVAPILFQKQASLEVYGELKFVPVENKVPGDRELHVDYYKIIGEAPGGPDSFTNVIPTGAHQSMLSDLRHLVLRRKEESMVMKAFQQYYKEHDMRESTAPSFVQTQVEGCDRLESH